ncbi:MAG: tRNA (adenosine(37)-N6)-dimethylallyltransferase MiaA, partial [Balneolaceae bacterium]
GYRNVIEHLNGEVSFEQMVKDIKTSTRRYAKRQITWFRRWPFIHWLDAELSPEENTQTICSKLNGPNRA